jgi:hypothetical protein
MNFLLKVVLFFSLSFQNIVCEYFLNFIVEFLINFHRIVILQKTCYVPEDFWPDKYLQKVIIKKDPLNEIKPFNETKPKIKIENITVIDWTLNIQKN